MKRYLQSVVLILFVFITVFPVRVSAVTIKPDSAVLGDGCGASGDNSTAMGFWSSAIGEKSLATGDFAAAIGNVSIAMGDRATAHNDFSIAIGHYIDAKNDYSTVIGKGWSVAYRLKNNVARSFMVGYMSGTTDTKPEFFVKDGAVGLGTKNPSAQLTVSTPSQTDTKILFAEDDAPGASIFYEGSAGAGTNNLVHLRSEISGSEQNVMTWKLNGTVGIMTSSPSYNLEVEGSAGKPFGGTWADSSDERLKTNIMELDGKEALEKIKQLQGVRYAWIHPEEHSDGVKAGVLAQNLEAVFPEWVSEIEPKGLDKELIPDGEKAKAISYPHDFNAYLIEAIKEQQKLIESQQQAITRLETEVATLRTLVIN